MLTSEQIIALESKYGAQNYAPLPVVVCRGEGVYVWDPEGNCYLDFLSGIGAVSQGHCHPKIIAALTEQAQRLTLASRAFYGNTFGPFAEYITKLFGYDRVLVMNTGVEAVEATLKLCRKWGYRTKGIPEHAAKIIFCQNNFHGRTVAAISASTSPQAQAGFGPFVPGIVHIPYDDIPALAEALKDPHVAAFVVEPIQGEGGVVVPQTGYLKAVRELCTAANVLFVADEIQTGIARTGQRLACDHEGVRPDVVLLGKSLSGGTMPVSAVLADDKVMLTFQPGDHGSTFGGNPLACAVALTALRVVEEEGLAANALRCGELFRQAVRDLKSPLITEVRGRGLLNAIVLDPELAPKGKELCLRLKALGLLARETRETVVRFAPPLIITPEQIAEGVRLLGKALVPVEHRDLAPPLIVKHGEAAAVFRGA